LQSRIFKKSSIRIYSRSRDSLIFLHIAQPYGALKSEKLEASLAPDPCIWSQLGGGPGQVGCDMSNSHVNSLTAYWTAGNIAGQ